MSGRFVYDPMGGGSTWRDDMDANFQADPQAMAQAQQWAQQVFKTGQNPFQTKGSAQSGYQAMDPATGQWGPGFVYADPTNPGARVIMPQSVASKIMPPSQLDSSNFNYSPSSANIGDSQFDTGLIPIAALGGLAGAAGLGAFETGGAIGATGATGAAGAEALSPYELAVAGGAAGPTGFGSLAGAGALAGAGSAVSTAATAGSSALKNIIDGKGTAGDWASLLGSAAPGLLGAYGASQQAGQLSDLADKALAIGAPSRGRYEASMAPGFDPMSIPGYAGALDSASKAVMSRLSTQGNPYGNPGGLIEANKAIVSGTELPAIQNYQAQNAATGGYSSLNGSYPGVAQQAIGSGMGGVYGGLGAAAANVFNPTQNTGTIADWLKALGNSNNTVSGISSGMASLA